MPSERIQQQIDRLLDEAEQAMGSEDWATVAARARAALRLDARNEDALAHLAAAASEAGQELSGMSGAVGHTFTPTRSPWAPS